MLISFHDIGSDGDAARVDDLRAGRREAHNMESGDDNGGASFVGHNSAGLEPTISGNSELFLLALSDNKMIRTMDLRKRHAFSPPRRGDGGGKMVSDLSLF